MLSLGRRINRFSDLMWVLIKVKKLRIIVARSLGNYVENETWGMSQAQFRSKCSSLDSNCLFCRGATFYPSPEPVSGGIAVKILDRTGQGCSFLIHWTFH